MALDRMIARNENSEPMDITKIIEITIEPILANANGNPNGIYFSDEK